MQGTDLRRRSAAPAALGIVLVVVGITFLAFRQAGVDVGAMIGEGGWPLFIIIPGLFLLAMAFVQAPREGLALAVAGSVVTAVGLILSYQQATGHWESWAYAWVLIPGAVGLATLTYGLASRRGDLVTTGLWIAVAAAALFVAGFWFFETVFETGRVPVNLGEWWPVVLIGLGVLLLAGSIVGSSRSHASPSDGDAEHLGGNPS